LATGSTSIDAALKLAQEAVKICDDAGFPLGKFSTHDVSLRAQLKSARSKFHAADTTVVDEQSECKLFGIKWSLNSDTFSFELSNILKQIEETKGIVTKRSILTTSLMLYDRMGLVTPLSIVPAILVQRCWVEGLGWDQPLSNHLKKKWEEAGSQVSNSIARYWKARCLVQHSTFSTYSAMRVKPRMV
jgi:Pao retrotransposon peptidase